eukprot:14590508-Alexandrium_andersonii.AAC.1
MAADCNLNHHAVARLRLGDGQRFTTSNDNPWAWCDRKRQQPHHLCTGVCATETVRVSAHARARVC